ncbi:DUF4493 domain-containing protein [Bacteroides caecigallinarum]|uniref:DUF4493 domain-containing protein n=1 Tax=Bacteroides caecigallinarum TaxID=1411144 RepID=UPI001F2C52BE|nr:DUF4493 domain-containing protein [Bacteroides caecigallinarum]MCF2553172.1 DUF4493 domain-containing protein [Bacteroides caecigallinarum]
MKLKNTILYIAALSLFSCEMKNEILDGNKNYEDVGYLNLGVYAQNKLSKAATDEGVSTNSPVSVDNFNVEINNSEGVFKEFDSYSELQAAGKIELPVGKYTVKAHTPGDIQPQMDSPYYYGETALEIVKGVEKTATVNCKMKNTKIQLVYGETFATVFKSWSITVSDGSSNILTYDQNDLNPSVIYWLIADNVSEITVHIVAFLQDGTKITEDRSITKPEDAESDYWAGSDALTITMEPGKPENPSGVTIDIKVEVSFTDSEVTEEIPVEPGGPIIPVPPVDEGPSISSQYLTSGISYNITANPDAVDSDPTSLYIMSGNPEEAVVDINADAGFKEILVKISTNNSGFDSAISAIGLNQAVNILDEDLNEMLVQVLNPPSVGDNTYQLDIASFFGMMNMYGPGEHSFDIEVLDQNDLKASATLSVIITLNE